MTRTLKTEITVLYILVVVLMAGFLGMKIAGDVAYRKGLVQGAKIGIVAETPGDYRVEQVRGACEDVFTTDECIQCHEF